MPERLPRELRILYEVARVVAAEPLALEAVLDRIGAEVGEDFGFENVRLVREQETQEDSGLVDRALARRGAVVADGRVAVPLLADGRCVGFLIADRGGEPLELDESELHLLSAIGLVAGLSTVRTEQYEQLRRALEELRRVDELKDDFISVASHELRAPVAVVHGIASTLHERSDRLSREQIDALVQGLHVQSARLRELTDQLLDLSRLDSGRIRVQRRPFRPRELVDTLLERVAPERRSDVRIEIDPRRELVSDPYAFERVVGNLLVNALEYGEPPVVVSAAERDDRYRLTVEDRGEGVPAAFVPHLFERFTRAEGTQRASAPGAGLGLAIAQEYAAAVGGELRYAPAEPHGARFVLTLRRAPL